MRLKLKIFCQHLEILVPSEAFPRPPYLEADGAVKECDVEELRAKECRHPLIIGSDIFY